MRILRNTTTGTSIREFEYKVLGQIELPKPLYREGQKVYVNYKPKIYGRPLKGVFIIHDINPMWILDPVEFDCWGYRMNERMAYRYIPENALTPTMGSYIEGD